MYFNIFNLFNIMSAYIIIIIIRFRQCQGSYRSSVAYRDNFPLSKVYQLEERTIILLYSTHEYYLHITCDVVVDIRKIKHHLLFRNIHFIICTFHYMYISLYVHFIICIFVDVS